MNNTCAEPKSRGNFTYISKIPLFLSIRPFFNELQPIPERIVTRGFPVYALFLTHSTDGNKTVLIHFTILEAEGWEFVLRAIF